MCGFNFAGDCRDFTPQSPSPYACSMFDASQGIYTHCHATAGDGRWPVSPPYRQVITSYTSP